MSPSGSHDQLQRSATAASGNKNSPSGMSPSQSNNSFASLRSTHSFHSFHVPHIKFHSFHGHHEHSKSWQVRVRASYIYNQVFLMEYLSFPYADFCALGCIFENHGRCVLVNFYRLHLSDIFPFSRGLKVSEEFATQPEFRYNCVPSPFSSHSNYWTYLSYFSSF